jgi:hypothetical protein
MSEVSAQTMPVRERLLRDPTFFPHKLDLIAERALFVHLDRAAILDASFLDDRVLSSQTAGAWIRLDQLDRSMLGAKFEKPVHYIFHIGHVGSTLLSRMLDQIEGTLGLREPMPLRTLAEASDLIPTRASLLAPDQFKRLIDIYIALWSRPFPETHSIILKATSSAARLGAQLLSQQGASQAIYLYLLAEPYLATLLAGANSSIDLRGHAQERVHRFERLSEFNLPQPVHALSPGELAAQAWLTEMLTLNALRSSEKERIQVVNFEDVLSAPRETLATICARLDLTADDTSLSRATSENVLNRYSKLTSEPYSPVFRRQVLDESRKTNATEIRRGLLWIEQIERHSPTGAQLLKSLPTISA